MWTINSLLNRHFFCVWKGKTHTQTLFTGLFNFIFSKERQWKNFNEKICVENITILPIYWHVILILLVLCPLTVLIICYSAIFWKVFEGETINRLFQKFDFTPIAFFFLLSSQLIGLLFCNIYSWIDMNKKYWNVKIQLLFCIKQKWHECYSSL